MAQVGKSMLAVHPTVAKRVLKEIDEQCSLYYIVIGSVYNLAQSAMVDAMQLLKKSKHYKHEIKRNSNMALEAYNHWNQKMKLKLWDKYQLWLDCSDAVADKMKMDIEKLRWSYDAELMKQGENEHTLKSYLLTAVTLNDIAMHTFVKFLTDGSEKIGIDQSRMFRSESSFESVKTNWEKAVTPLLHCSAGNIDCNNNKNCVLASDIICKKLANFNMYEEACAYGAELNMDIVEQYIEN